MVGRSILLPRQDYSLLDELCNKYHWATSEVIDHLVGEEYDPERKEAHVPLDTKTTLPWDWPGAGLSVCIYESTRERLEAVAVRHKAAYEVVLSRLIRRRYLELFGTIPEYEPTEEYKERKQALKNALLGKPGYSLILATTIGLTTKLRISEPKPEPKPEPKEQPAFPLLSDSEKNMLDREEWTYASINDMLVQRYRAGRDSLPDCSRCTDKAAMQIVRDIACVPSRPVKLVVGEWYTRKTFNIVKDWTFKCECAGDTPTRYHVCSGRQTYQACGGCGVWGVRPDVV
jgi:hypothetical protein